MAEKQLDGDRIGNWQLHHLSERSLILACTDLHLKHTLVDSHLPMIPGFTTFAIRALAAWHHQPSGWQRDWSSKFDVRTFTDIFDLVAYKIDISVIFTGQFDDSYSSQIITPSLSSPLLTLTESLLVDLHADAGSDGLTHVADSEAGQLREGVHLLDCHRLGRLETN